VNWYEKNIRNDKARDLLAKLTAPRFQVPTLISNAAKEAGIDDCPYARSLGPVLPGKVTTIDASGLALVDASPMVAVSASAISLDSKVIVPLKNGSVDASDLEGGALGMRIPRLTQYIESADLSPPDGSPQVRSFDLSGELPPPLNVFAEANVSYRLLFQVIASLRRSKYRQFSLVVASSSGALGSLPLHLPDHTPRAMAMDESPAPEPGDEPLQLIASITKDKIVLWSISGLEGTLMEPKLVIPRDGGGTAASGYDFNKLRAALEEIAERRWAGKERPNESHDFLLQFDGDVPFQIVAAGISATQKTSGGEDLFASTMLAKPSFD
jgi:hypothetical protein